MSYPHELALGDVYFSPILIICALAFIFAGITAILLNKLKLSKFIYAPSYVFISIFILYVLAIDAFWIKF